RELPTEKRLQGGVSGIQRKPSSLAPSCGSGNDLVNSRVSTTSLNEFAKERTHVASRHRRIRLAGWNKSDVPISFCAQMRSGMQKSTRPVDGRVRPRVRGKPLRCCARPDQ